MKLGLEYIFAILVDPRYDEKSHIAALRKTFARIREVEEKIF